MSDIVDRLRFNLTLLKPDWFLFREAADEIERLRAQVEALMTEAAQAREKENPR